MVTPNQEAPDVAVGVILAGGQARRMGGGDKPLKQIAGRTMLDRVIARLSPQVTKIVLNANGDPARFSATGLPVAADPVEGFAGPLAGVLAGMRWAKANAAHARFILTVAGDTPFFPLDLGSRFFAAAGGDEGTIALAETGGKAHPVFGLWPVALADDLHDFLTHGETRKVLAWADRHGRVDVPFDAITVDDTSVDPFFNVNTPEDMSRAERIARVLEGEPA